MRRITLCTFLLLVCAPLRASAQTAGTIAVDAPPAKAPASAPPKATASAPAQAPGQAPAKAAPGDGSTQLIRPATRGMLVSVALGPAFRLKGLPSQFNLEAAFAYHFRKGPVGPAFGGALGAAFGNQMTTVELGARFWWDFQLLSAYGLYVGPFVQAGWRFLSDNRCIYGTTGQPLCNESYNDSFFGVALGVDVRLLFDDRWFVLLRPAAFTLDFGSEAASRYELLFGGGVTF